MEPLPATQFKEILENAVSRVEDVSGRFAQVAGFRFTYDPNGTPQELDADGNVVTPGTRVISANLDDGTPIIEGGNVVAGAPDISISTINFLATGGDQYPFRGADFTVVGVTYQQALANYIVQVLNGTITAEDYPEGGEGRINEVMNFIGGNLPQGLSVTNDAMGLNYFPNPVSNQVTIRFDMEAEGQAQLQLFDLNGQQIATVFNGTLGAGRQELQAEMAELPKGSYILLLRANGQQTAASVVKQ
jgi:hypothetical protein